MTAVPPPPIRSAVAELGKLGPLPEADDSAEDSVLQRYEQLLGTICEPLNVAEATIIAGIFPRSTCFGLEWTLLHLLERSQDWPSAAMESVCAPRWRRELETRLTSRS